MSNYEARNQEIIRLSKEKKTSTEIARILGLKSRNVAIGVLARAKLKGDKSIPGRDHYRKSVRQLGERERRSLEAQAREAKEREVREQARLVAEKEMAERLRLQAEERARRVLAMTKEREANAPLLTGIRWSEPNTLDPSQGVSILNVRHGQCRAVQDHKHEGLAVFCGDVTLPGKSFCDMHYKLFYTRSFPQPQKTKNRLSIRLIRGYA
jgi:hypothetical protein